jgi:aconitate hydratase
MVIAVAFSGSLSFNPIVDQLTGADGKPFKFEAPVGDELPKAGYEFSLDGFEAPADDVNQRKTVKIAISSTSERIAEIDIFKPWNGKDIENLVVLMKAKGKCTTDHISPAGPWLKYRGHLPNISNNMFTGATNFFTGEIGKTTNVLTGEKSKLFNEAAKAYKAAGQDWIAVGDTNYGEGSSREHAAMSPRYLGCRAVVVRSFARIHESNLKKQGVLPLTFVDPASYDLIGETDRVSIVGLTKLAPGSMLTLKIKGPNGEKEAQVKHTLTEEEIRWFKAGSALNTLNPNIKA